MTPPDRGNTERGANPATVAGETPGQQKRRARRANINRVSAGPETPAPDHGRSRHPWAQMMTAYVEGVPDGNPNSTKVHYPTLRWISEQFSVDLPQVRKHSASEKWPERRQNHQARVQRERRAQRQVELAAYASDMDERAMTIARKGYKVIEDRMNEIAFDQAARSVWFEQRRRAFEAGDVDGVDWSDAGPVKVDGKEVEVLASAMLKWQELGKRAIGDDVARVEVTGAGGGPIQSVHTELLVDDPHRLANVAATLQRAGAMDALVAEFAAGPKVIDPLDAVTVHDPPPEVDPYSAENGYDIADDDEPAYA